MLFKLKHTFFIIFIPLLVLGCQSKQLTSIEKSQQVKEKADRKRKEKARAEQEKARKKHYNMQAESTKTLMDYNKSESEKWIKKNYHNQSFFEKIKSFFQNFKRRTKPDKGLFSKKQKRKTKKNIFQRIFKKKK
ncbi:MAG: hypothetical protein R6V23_03840 [Bacteroidales bacterium]